MTPLPPKDHIPIYRDSPSRARRVALEIVCAALFAAALAAAYITVAEILA